MLKKWWVLNHPSHWMKVHHDIRHDYWVLHWTNLRHFCKRNWWFHNKLVILLCGKTSACLEEETHSYINDWYNNSEINKWDRHFMMLSMKQNDTEPSITSAEADSWTWSSRPLILVLIASMHTKKRHLLFFIHESNTCNMLTKSKLLFVNKYIHVWQSLYNAKYSKHQK